MSFFDSKSAPSGARRCLRASLLLGLVLAANPGPQWLWTLKGCRYLLSDQVEQFNTQMDRDLHGCLKYPNPLADVYKCGDGGAYMIFWTQPVCDGAVEKYRKDHQT
jgi:hypothetical protein